MPTLINESKRLVRPIPLIKKVDSILLLTFRDYRQTKVPTQFSQRVISGKALITHSLS